MARRRKKSRRKHPRVCWREYVANSDVYDERRRSGTTLVLVDDGEYVMTLKPITAPRRALPPKPT